MSKIEATKRQFFHMVTHVFDNSNLSRDFCDRYLESCNMLFGTWSQAHANDPSDHMETRLKNEWPLFFTDDLITSYCQVADCRLLLS